MESGGYSSTDPFRSSQDEILRYSRQECLRYAEVLRYG
jgi:hypothetical protein